MRRNVNKLVAFAIGISVISGSIMPVFAADDNQTITSEVSKITNSASNDSTAVSSTLNNSLAISSTVNVQNQVKQKNVLTLKEAIDSAVSNSEKLALKDKEIKLYKDKADIQQEIDDFKDLDEDDNFPYDKLKVTVKQTEDQKKYTKDQITEDITAKYNNIVSMRNALDKLKKQIELQNTQNGYVKLKKEIGMSTSLDISNSEIDLQKLKNSEKAQENQLKNAEDYFKVITDKDIHNYALEQDQEYKPFRIEGSLDEYFDGVVDKYFKYDRKLVEMTEDNLHDNKVDRPDKNDRPDKDNFNKTIKNADGTTNTVFDSDAYEKASQAYVNEWNDYGTYLQNKFNYNSSKVSLDDNKKNLKNGLKESYASLISSENDINVAKSNIDIKNKELAIAKLKYDEGLMTKVDYDKLVLDYGDLETNLRTSINSYNKLKNQIQKPWLLSNAK